MKKSNFEQLVQKSFVKLEVKYGFKKTKSDYHSGGVTVCFQNLTTEVVLNYEIGDFPWITIADINNPKAARASLDWLLVELGEIESPTVDAAFLPARMEEEQLEAELKKKSNQLLEFSADFLKGDFTLLPKLQERADDYLEECQKFAGRHKSAS